MTTSCKPTVNVKNKIRVRAVGCGLWTVDCGMGTADCRLGIKYGLGIKRGLRTGYKIRTTDYFGENGAQLVIFA